MTQTSTSQAMSCLVLTVNFPEGCLASDGSEVGTLESRGAHSVGEWQGQSLNSELWILH